MQGELTLDGLYEIRQLLTKMAELNRQECSVEHLRDSRRPIQQKQEKPNRTPSIIVVMAMVALYFVVRLALTISGELRAGMRPSVVWGSLFYDIPIVAVLVAAAGGIAMAYFRFKDRGVDEVNRQIEEQNRVNGAYNLQIRAKREENEQKLQAIRQQRQLLVNRYGRHCDNWFPQSYGYMEAVNFFIGQVQNHTTDREKVIDRYLDYKRDQETRQYREDMRNFQRVNIENQSLMISQQDEIIRQQMIGNVINLFTLSQVMWNSYY